ncbi:hypothetical protein A2U01_0033032 [Trifolium medium]|uniref:Uncharacterized protein n=1 Tax=Trifolium medium TaxID=97028 RepID=A0A392PKA1_9FABA|nr:hypothetical protein [Trifolium medium]
MRRSFNRCICAFPVLAGLSHDDGDSSLERYFMEALSDEAAVEFCWRLSRISEFGTSTTGILLGIGGSLTSSTSLLCKISRLIPW